MWCCRAFRSVRGVPVMCAGCRARVCAMGGRATSLHIAYTQACHRPKSTPCYERAISQIRHTTARSRIRNGESTIRFTACAATRTHARLPIAAPCEGAMSLPAADRRSHRAQPATAHGSARRIGRAARDSCNASHAPIPTIRQSSQGSLQCHAILFPTFPRHVRQLRATHR